MKTVIVIVVGMLFLAPILAQPRITAVVSAADSQPGVVLGGLATVYGTGLSDAQYFLSALPYPTKMGPTEVLLCVPSAAQYASAAGCIPLGLTYAGPTQINIYFPDSLPNLPGMVPDSLSVVVRNGGILDVDAAAGKAQWFNLRAPQPRIFFEGYDCLTDPRYNAANVNCGLTFTGVPRTTIQAVQAVRGAVADQQGAVLSSANRARVGQYYTIWMTGLGQFTYGKPNVPVSMNFTDVPIYGSSDTNWVPATLSYVGPSTYLGLYQINFQVPPVVAEGTLIGDYSIQYTTQFPCADYNWEITLLIAQPEGLTALGTKLANAVQIPLAVKNGDVPCTK